jgi:hypothetical protein
MHQVRWLALGGLSLVLLVLILVHFTFFGTLLVRFYHRKNITTHNINTQAYTRHKQCSTPYHIIKEYQKQTSLESKQYFKGS